MVRVIGSRLYIVLTKREGRTGRISARGLHRKDRGSTFSQYGPEQVWSIRDLLHDWREFYKFLISLKKKNLRNEKWPNLIEGLPSVSWREGFYSFGVQAKNSDKPLQCRNQFDLSVLLLIEPIRFILSTESIKHDMNCQNFQKKGSVPFSFNSLLSKVKKNFNSTKFFQRGNRVDCFNVLNSWKVFKMSQMNGWFGMSKLQ